MGFLPLPSAFGNDRAGLGPISGDLVEQVARRRELRREPARSLNLQNREIWKVFRWSA